MKNISEEKDQELIKSWYAEARKQKPETLKAFIDSLSHDYKHDYGTICHAIAACALAGACSMERGEQGGITGFQAGAVMWQFIQEWLSEEPPLWLMRGKDLLYPQCKHKFTRISAKTWKWVQNKAREELNAKGENVASPNVINHWKAISLGVVPFGLEVEED